MTVRATGRESYLGVEPPRLRRDLSGFWPHSAASAALAPTGLRLWTIFVKQSDFRWLAPVDKTIPQWTSVVFHRRLLCHSILIRLGPLKRGGFAASFQWTRAEELHAELWVTPQRVWGGGAAGYSVLLALRRRVTFSPVCLANSCGVTCSSRFASRNRLHQVMIIRRSSRNSALWV